MGLWNLLSRVHSFGFWGGEGVVFLVSDIFLRTVIASSYLQYITLHTLHYIT